jgi:type I restriction enzyme S subunit
MNSVPLEDLVEILDHKRIPINSTERAERLGEVPYYGATGQVGTIDKALFNETLILLGEDGVPFFDSAKHKAYEISGPSWVNNHAHVLKAKSELIKQRYLLHYLNSFNYVGYVNGTTRLKLTQRDMRRIPVPLPSLEKQMEITNKLDSVFAEIEMLVKETESDLKLLRRIYDQEIENIFHRNVNHWPSTTIGDSCDYKNGKAHEQIVDPKGKYRLVTSKFVSSDGKLARRVTSALTPLASGDVAFVLSDLPKGKALAKAYLVEDEDDLTLNQRVLRVRSSSFDSRFLYLQINRHPYLLSFDNGESQTHLKLAQVLSCKLLIPNLAIQKQTTDRLFGLRAEVEKAEGIFQHRLSLLSSLRQSFLHHAFNYSEADGIVA